MFPPDAKGSSKPEDVSTTLHIILAVALPVLFVILVGVALYFRYLHLLFSNCVQLGRVI